jgi:hypothetical protein
MNMTNCHDQNSNGNKEVRVEYPARLDGLRVSWGVGPMFLYHEGVQYGSTVKYQDVILNRTWSAAEAKIYPCA